MNLYGKTKHGSVEKRLDAITDILGVKQDGEQQSPPRHLHRDPKRSRAERSKSAPASDLRIIGMLLQPLSQLPKQQVSRKLRLKVEPVAKSTSQSANQATKTSPAVTKRLNPAHVTVQQKAANQPTKKGSPPLKALKRSANGCATCSTQKKRRQYATGSAADSNNDAKEERNQQPQPRSSA